jgi:hypothetical protein
MHTQGVAARKDEKQRIKDLNQWIKTHKSSDPPPPLLFQSIDDPEMKWKATNPTWIAEEAKKSARKHGYSQTQSTLVARSDEGADSDIEIVVDGPWLERDFVAFDKEEDKEEFDIEKEFLPGGGTMKWRIRRHGRMKKMNVHSDNCMEMKMTMSLHVYMEININKNVMIKK